MEGDVRRYMNPAKGKCMELLPLLLDGIVGRSEKSSSVVDYGREVPIAR
jgi:hypothetical protein